MSGIGVVGQDTGSGGSGSGTVTGSGTVNRLAKFTAAGAIGNSSISNPTALEVVINSAQGSTSIGDTGGVGTLTTLVVDDAPQTVAVTASGGFILNGGTGLNGQTGSGTSIVTNTAPTITGLTATGTTLLQLPIPGSLPGTNLEGEIQGRSDGTLWYGSDVNTWSQVNTANTVITVPGGGTGAATFTANGVLYGNTTSALQVTAQGAANSVLIASAGAPSFSQAPIINTSVQLGVVSSATGLLKLANSASANLTTIQAGNAAAARTYTWPTNFGAAGTALTDAAGDGTLSWAAAGAGTVTVVSSGSLTSTALVTGGGTTTLQTPSATSTLDSSGNMSLPGTLAATTTGTITRSALGVTPADGMILNNATAAALAAQQISPRIRLTGQGWETNGSSSQTNSWTIENLPVQGSAASTANLLFKSSINGGAYSTQFTLTSGGSLTIGSSLQAGADIGSSSTAGVIVGSRGGMRASADSKLLLTGNSQTGLQTLSLGPTVPSVIGSVPAQGQTVTILQAMELLTIAAAATSTTTMQVPAGAVILSVSVRVTTAIPTATTFTVIVNGISFNTVAVATAANSTDVGTNANVATVATYPYIGTASGVVITPNLTPGDATGRVRVTVAYYQITVPSS